MLYFFQAPYWRSPIHNIRIMRFCQQLSPFNLLLSLIFFLFIFIVKFLLILYTLYPIYYHQHRRVKPFALNLDLFRLEVANLYWYNFLELIRHNWAYSNCYFLLFSAKYSPINWGNLNKLLPFDTLEWYFKFESHFSDIFYIEFFICPLAKFKLANVDLMSGYFVRN